MAEVAMVEFDDYEALPQRHPLWVHMVAGAAAGVMEHCTMYPIDVVKTRMQSMSAECPEGRMRSPFKALVSVVRRDGIFRVVRGVQAVAVGAVPAHALYFTVYDQAKRLLVEPGRWLADPQYHMIGHGISGVGATVVHDAVMNPAEVVKQRMQMFCCPYNGTLECARCILRSEGLRAFYRSYPVQLLMNIPFHSTHFICYEVFQKHLNPQKRYNPMSHLISGGIAGGVAAALTTPLDVMKTVLNTQESLYVCSPVVNTRGTVGHLKPATTFSATYARTAHSHTRTHQPVEPSLNASNLVLGLRGAFSRIYTERGFLGFFSGIRARVLFQVPSTAIAWSVYELFKHILDGDATY